MFQLSLEKENQISVTIKMWRKGTSLVVQWLRLCTPNAGGLGSIPGWGTSSHMTQQKKIPHVASKNQHSQINKNKCFEKCGQSVAFTMHQQACPAPFHQFCLFLRHLQHTLCPLAGLRTCIYRRTEIVCLSPRT